MSIFSDLPAYPPTLDSGHAAAAGLTNSFLFNAGSGTTVRDDKGEKNHTTANSPTWDAGGGMNFGAYALLDLSTGGGWGGRAAAWSIVAGILVPNMSGYRSLIGPYSGNWLGLNAGSTYVSGLTITSSFTDGVPGVSGLSNDTAYVLAWRCSVGDLASDCYIGNGNAWTHWNGRVAFLYVFDSSLDDTALAARALTLANYPYQFYGGTQPPASNPWPDALAPIRPHMIVGR